LSPPPPGICNLILLLILCYIVCRFVHLTEP